MTSPLPDLQLDVRGEYTGNAYPEPGDYRITLTVLGTGTDYGLIVENASGGVLNSVILSDKDADGILKVAGTNHSLDVYEDDWTIPVNIERTVHWDLGDAENYVRLDESGIEEVAAWLRYATGEDEWTGGEEWMF